MTDVDVVTSAGSNGVDPARAKALADEARLDALRVKYAKIGVVLYSGHELVFRRPTRVEASAYARKKETDEKVDALNFLAQMTIVSFDGEEDPNRARVVFTGTFLEEYPLAMNNPKFMACLGACAGLVEEEDEKDLGKGVSVRSKPRGPSPKV